MTSVGFGSAFCFQGLQDLYSDSASRVTRGMASVLTKTQEQMEEVSAAAAQHVKAKKPGIIGLVVNDILNSIPIIAQIQGITDIGASSKSYGNIFCLIFTCLRSDTRGHE